ncbi:hypothetical protein I4U23_012103 [Adineta vaga]|nr:hypothetical protein I4U23_012103 [Adineta vaga]
MPFKAEYLPSEIWLYTFSYLEGHDLIHAFSDLNLFFTSLLHSQYLYFHIRIKKNESNQQLPTFPWSQIPLNKISSLAVGQRKANCLIQFLRWNAQYLTGLRSLSIYLRKSKLDNNVQSLTLALQQIPSLYSIRIKYSAKFDFSIDLFEPLMMCIFSNQSSIQKCSLDFQMCCDKMKTLNWSRNFSLKYLQSNQTAWIDLSTLLSFAPYLRSLQAEMRLSDTRIYEKIVLIHLNKANLILNRPRFVQLELFKEKAPNLNSLCLQGSLCIKDENYFNEDSWHRLLHNIKYYQVYLTEQVWLSSLKRTVSNYIRDLKEKNWFSSNEDYTKVFVKFTSAI